MSPAPSIQCAKCSKAANDADAKCTQCGGNLVRVCGDCQFKNSLAKRFCDRCGSRLRPDTIISKKAPNVRGGRPAESSREPQGPQLPGTSMGSGFDPFRGSAQQQQKITKPAQPTYRPHGNSEVSPSRVPTTLQRRDRGPGRLSLVVSSLGSRFGKARADSNWLGLALTALAGLSAVYGSIMIGLQVYRIVTPEAPVMTAARTYLDAVNRHDFTTAYDMLSEASKAQSTRAEFANLQELRDWQYSELNLASLEGSLAVLQYSLKGTWQKAQDQYLIFVKEKGHWTIDRDRDLLARIEDAFDRRDSAEAYRLSIQAVQTHRWDPLAHADLCEAAYARKLRSEAESQCRQALDASAALPYRLTAATRQHLSLIMADIANDDRRYSESVAQYSSLLSAPNLLPIERCRLLLARTDTEIAASQFPQALKDVQAADGACKMPEERDYLSRVSRILDGSAGDDAISLVKSHRIDPEGTTVLDWTNEHHGGNWSSEHLSGGKYKVELNGESGMAVEAMVDLWSRNIDTMQPENFE